VTDHDGRVHVDHQPGNSRPAAFASGNGSPVSSARSAGVEDGGGWHWRRWYLSPPPSVLVSISTDGGIGGGALAIPLFAMARGYAVSGGGRTWGRATAGPFALAPIVGWAAAAAAIAGDRLAIGTPRGAWAALISSSFLVVLALGCAIPHRAAMDPGEPD
jgi:hypothetical protein